MTTKTRIADLENGLRKYGKHCPSCAVFRCTKRTARSAGPPLPNPGPCDCGLDDLLKGSV